MQRTAPTPVKSIPVSFLIPTTDTSVSVQFVCHQRCRLLPPPLLSNLLLYHRRCCLFFSHRRCCVIRLYGLSPFPLPPVTRSVYLLFTTTESSVCYNNRSTQPTPSTSPPSSLSTPTLPHPSPPPPPSPSPFRTCQTLSSSSTSSKFPFTSEGSTVPVCMDHNTHTTPHPVIPLIAPPRRPTLSLPRKKLLLTPTLYNFPPPPTSLPPSVFKSYLVHPLLLIVLVISARLLPRHNRSSSIP